MIDQYQREIDYLRISITERCNLKCIYCMPEDCHFHSKMLSVDEIVTIVKLFTQLGFKKVKITGGEPLVRKDVVEIVKAIKAIDKIEEVTMTTNGIYLERYLDDLIEAGLDAINISIDSLDEKMYQQLTQSNGAKQVYKMIIKASKTKLKVKVNCVPIKGKNHQHLLDLALLAKDYPIHVRFIELMPIGLGTKLNRYTEQEIKECLKPLGLLQPFNQKLGNGPSHYYMIEGFKGKIGFISALSHRFCHKCNRVRITSDGKLKTCLQFEESLDLCELLNSSTALNQIKQAIYLKPKNHVFEENKTYETRMMSQIGG